MFMQKKQIADCKMDTIQKQKKLQNMQNTIKMKIKIADKT